MRAGVVSPRSTPYWGDSLGNRRQTIQPHPRNGPQTTDPHSGCVDRSVGIALFVDRNQFPGGNSCQSIVSASFVGLHLGQRGDLWWYPDTDVFDEVLGAIYSRLRRLSSGATEHSVATSNVTAELRGRGRFVSQLPDAVASQFDSVRSDQTLLPGRGCRCGSQVLASIRAHLPFPLRKGRILTARRCNGAANSTSGIPTNRGEFAQGQAPVTRPRTTGNRG